MIPASVLMKLATLGLPVTQAEVVATMLADVEAATRNEANAVAEQGREKARARWHKWKSNQETNDSKRLPTTANASKRLVCAEDSSSNKQITGKEEKEDTAPVALSDLQGFKSELSELDAERVEALIKHRRAKKAQLTAHAARLFKADASKASLSLAAAVDTCISRNWVTVKADWLQGSVQRQATSPPKPQSIGDMFRQDAKRMGLINDQPTNTASERLDSGDGAAEGSSTGIARRFALPANVLGDLGQS